MAKTGERKAQILQTLAAMLEDPKGERITTALLAARLEVSEAALYRHFSSKAQMFEGLIEFIEQTVFTLVNRIQSDEPEAMKQINKGFLIGSAISVVGFIVLGFFYLNFNASNARPEVQAIADLVVGSNADDGLAEFLDQLVDQGKVAPPPS